MLPFLAFGLFIFHSAFSKSDAFIGWDTPAYVYSVKILAQEGPLVFLKFWEYHRFTYSLILYAFYPIWPGGLFTLAKILPIFFAFLSTFLIGVLLFQWFKDSVLAFLGAAFSFVWIAPYALASNLFAQLLGLNLSLIWLAYAFKPQTKKVRGLFYLVFLLAAITHVYTMIFLYLAFILSNLTTWIFTSKNDKQNNSRKQIVTHCLILGVLVVLPLFLSTVLMNSTRVFGPLLNPQQIEESARGVRQISPSLLFVSFGANLIFTMPIAFVFVLASFVRSRGLAEKLKYSFILWWTAVASALPFVSYVFPHLISLTERIIIIMPIPILAALFARKLLHMLSRTAEKRIQNCRIGRVVRSQRVKGVLLSAIVVPMFLANVCPIQDNVGSYLRSWITQDTLDSLESLRQIPLSEKPLFVINANEEAIADLAGLWDNTIGAYVGPHYTYLGPIQNLANLQRTVFYFKPSDIWSIKFFDQLNQSQILSYDGLANRSTILLKSFYTLKDYEIPYVHNAGDGIFLLDFGKLWTNRSQLIDKAFLQAYTDVTEKAGHWYGINREWSSNPYVLELYANVSGNEYASYTFYVSNSSVFSVKMRYFDFAGYDVPLDFCIDNETIMQVKYKGTGKPEILEVSTPFLFNGWHEISIRVASQGVLLVNLDYILVEPK